MDYGAVERNLRDMFRHLAAGRLHGETRELAGITIASAGSEFQMFNAAFFNSPVEDQVDLDRRIALAKVVFGARSLPWSLWVCEELLAEPLRKRLGRSCERAGLHLGSEMPAMAADRVAGAGVTGGATNGGELEIRPVQATGPLNEFCRIGASCFRVPLPWFEEIFDSAGRLSGRTMAAWIGYYKGKAVSTVAAVESPDVIGIYNLATLTPFRERGFGEAMLRYAVCKKFAHGAEKPIVLQSTRQGLRLYERLGFRSVGRVLVFPSR